MAIMGVNANNRTELPDIDLGILDALDYGETSIRWCGTHQKVTKYNTITDAWICYNDLDTPLSVNVYGKASVDVILMFINAYAIYTTINK